jgi:hypothetical protein
MVPIPKRMRKLQTVRQFAFPVAPSEFLLTPYAEGWFSIDAQMPFAWPIDFLQLLNIRLGPGAAVLPKNISRLHLDFAFYIEGGHRGPRWVLTGLLSLGG